MAQVQPKPLLYVFADGFLIWNHPAATASHFGQLGGQVRLLGMRFQRMKWLFKDLETPSYISLGAAIPLAPQRRCRPPPLLWAPLL